MHHHLIFGLINRSRTLEHLKQVHAQSITTGLLSLHPSLLPTKILHSFTLLLLLLHNTSTTSTGLISYASRIFKEIPSPSTFSYNTIIRAHTLLSSPLSALLLFRRMRRSSLPPDSHSFPFALKACFRLHSLPLALSLHSQALSFGFGAHIFVLNTLIHLYSSCSDSSHSLPHALRLFDEIPQPDVVSYNALLRAFLIAGHITGARNLFDQIPIKDAVSWATLLSGYSQTNHCKQAIQLLDDMISLGIKPDNVALVSALSACAQLGALEKGEFIHNYIKQNGIAIESFLSTGLVDMYSKCGRLDIAMDTFEAAHRHNNLFTWNAMILGLAMHGHAHLSLQYFARMKAMGVQPDGVTLLGVLVGCSHGGLLHEARQLFHEMESVHGVRPELKHYGCMADLLGRAGLTGEIVEMMEGMPMESDVFVWSGLLNGCRIRGNVELAEIAAKHIMCLDPSDGGVYSIMATIYANAKRWEDVANVRRLMNAMTRINKNAGCSAIEIGGTTHEFIAADTLHPQVHDVYLVLDGVGRQKFQCNIF